MKYYIIAGEASGDLHASNLMKAIKQKDQNADFRFWGGDLMQKQGGTLVKHYRDLAFMGFLEVVQNLKTILGNIKFCKKDILENKPDVLILVDYPGFNLRIAKFAKELGIKVVYYISPQLWAYFLITSKITDAAKKIVFGNREDLEVLLMHNAIQTYDFSDLRDKRVLVKGCSDEFIPNNAYVELVEQLKPLVKSLMFGEACSNVPIFKK